MVFFMPLFWMLFLRQWNIFFFLQACSRWINVRIVTFSIWVGVIWIITFHYILTLVNWFHVFSFELQLHLPICRYSKVMMATESVTDPFFVRSLVYKAPSLLHRTVLSNSRFASVIWFHCLNGVEVNRKRISSTSMCRISSWNLILYKSRFQRLQRLFESLLQIL